MKITGLSVRRFRQNQTTAANATAAEIQLVELETDEGLCGTGFLTAANSRYAATADMLAGVLRTSLHNIVLGEDPLLTEALWQRMYELVAPRRGARGILLNCIAAVDFAAWDIRARAGSTYITGGEQHSGLIEFRSLLEAEAVDVIQPGAGIAGGITPWLKVYELACAHGVPVSPWDLQAVHIHMAAGLPNVKW